MEMYLLTAEQIRNIVAINMAILPKPINIPTDEDIEAQVEMLLSGMNKISIGIEMAKWMRNQILTQ